MNGDIEGDVRNRKKRAKDDKGGEAGLGDDEEMFLELENGSEPSAVEVKSTFGAGMSWASGDDAVIPCGAVVI